MSLLMDALKRAEEAKRQQSAAAGGTGAAATEPGAGLSLEPVGTPSGLPDLNSHLESVDADLKATAAENARENHRSPAYAATAATIAAQRNTAQAVFAAKQETDTPASAMKRFLFIGAIGLVLAAGVGGYFYWQLQTISGAGNRLVAKPGAPMPTRPVAAAPLPQIPAAAPAPAPELAIATTKPAPEAAAPAPKVAAQPAPVATTPKTSPRPDRTQKLAANDAPTRKRTAAATLPEPPVQQPAGDGGLRISTQSQESAVQRAYDDLQAGRLDAARTGYQQALRADPRNGDALVGLATISQREGDKEAAERYYQQAIAADPRNAGAHAGLVSLRGEGDGTASESRLKTLIAQQGSDPAASGALNFALGNVYAGQRRWNEAQQAYFKAHSADAEHPDYLYNLAVSLDHLAQGKLAAQFYEKAIKATQKRPGAFDKAQGERRLTELQK